MVKKLLLLFFMPLTLMALGNVNVTAELNQYSIAPNVPLQASMMVTHPLNLEVDLASATIDGKPLTLALIKKVPLGGDEIIEIYQFTLPPYQPGEYEMPIINIKVGGDNYSTLPVRFIIPKEGSVASKGASSEPPYLSIQSEVKSPGSVIYPGQRISLIYRYIYRGDVQLTKEVLPLFKQEGFTKIGEEEVKDYEQGGNNIREFTLDVQVKDPGTYQFAAAQVEGMGYSTDTSPQKMTAKTEPLTITVAPFPNAQQPTTFEGAYGKFSIKTSLLNSGKLSVGDKLLFAIDVYGTPKDLLSVTLPKLVCQPGFSGMFSFDAVPVPGIIDQEKKRFVLPLRPTNDQITQIPSVYLSFFEPTAKEYQTIKSEPIAIKVSPVANIIPKDPVQKQLSGSTENWNKELAYLKPLKETDITFLGAKDLRNLGAGTWYVLWLLPIGISALAGQAEWKKRIDLKKLQPKKATSQDLFRQAMASQGQDDLFYWLLSRALILQMFEQGLIPNSDVATADLPECQIKNFLLRLERSRFGNSETLSKTAVAEEARTLFNRSQG